MLAFRGRVRIEGLRMLQGRSQSVIGTRGYAAAAVLLCAGVSVAHGQWTVTKLHPAGATESRALAVAGGQQVGFVKFGTQEHASLWSGSAASWIDLHPEGATRSVARSVNGGRQAGEVIVSNGPGHASVWSGTAASWIDLDPAGSTGSSASGTSGTQQVGVASVGEGARACLWNGTAASWIELGGGPYSAALATSGTQQVGHTADRASLWSGTAASHVDLHPGFALRSFAVAIGDGQQGGRVQVGNPSFFYTSYASLWTGTAASWVSLHPGEFNDASGVAAVGGGYQVGNLSSIKEGWFHAALWRGTAASWVDLHAFVSLDYFNSAATGVWVDATTVYVAGYGIRDEFGPGEAMLWSRPICAGDFNRSGTGDIEDVYAFFNAWFTNDASADFNGRGLTVDDLFLFLDAWFSGC